MSAQSLANAEAALKQLVQFLAVPAAIRDRYAAALEETVRLARSALAK